MPIFIPLEIPEAKMSVLMVAFSICLASKPAPTAGYKNQSVSDKCLADQINGCVDVSRQSNKQLVTL